MREFSAEDMRVLAVGLVEAEADLERLVAAGLPDSEAGRVERFGMLVSVMTARVQPERLACLAAVAAIRLTELRRGRSF